MEKKEARLTELTEALNKATTDRTRFDALSNLYDEYHSFNADSAYNISLQQEIIAQRLAEPTLMAQARLHRADILSATGMYHETLELIDSIKVDELPQYLHPYYFHIKRTVYGRLADFAAFEPEKQRYSNLTEIYRDSIMATNEANSLAHIITKADCFNLNGNPQAAVDVLDAFMTNNDLSEHERAICAWTLSDAYARLGNRTKQKEQLIRSSISDLKSSVREYMSLRQLAL
ncbi:MAG: hypothetical protein K2F78_01665, partial [Muribaculaceae bacterium]|nr:hypothetical protein [Muribaculaceae bacterium]